MLFPAASANNENNMTRAINMITRSNLVEGLILPAIFDPLEESRDLGRKIKKML